jgi:hypothetical protein
MDAVLWGQVSRTLDYILAQKKPVRESPAVYGIRGEVEKPRRKPKKEKKEQKAEQLTLF